MERKFANRWTDAKSVITVIEDQRGFRVRYVRKVSGIEVAPVDGPARGTRKRAEDDASDWAEWQLLANNWEEVTV